MSRIRKVKVFVTAKDSRTESIVGYSYIKVAENIPKILIDNVVIRQTVHNRTLAEREYTIFVLGKSQDEIIEDVLRAIRKSSTEGTTIVSLHWAHGWRRDYGYDFKNGNYWAQGYGHSGYATTGWHDQAATIYTEEEMKVHITKNFRKFQKALDEIEGIEV